MGTTKRGHMITRAYLEPWADQKGQIEVRDLESRKVYTTNIKNATVVRYVYEDKVFKHDLEAKFAEIEGHGVAVLRKLREGQPVSSNEKHRALQFMQMFRLRGTYSGEHKTPVPGVMVRLNIQTGQSELGPLDLSLGDKLFLAQLHDQSVDLQDLGLEAAPWRVVTYERPCLATGDAAVQLWGDEPPGSVSAITFPLSPHELLVIGTLVPVDQSSLPMFINHVIAQRSRRWLIGPLGSLNMEFFDS